MTAPQLIFHGQILSDQNCNLEKVIEELQLQREVIHKYSIHDLLVFFDQLVHHWQSSGITKKNPYLKNISEFLSQEYLESSLKIALRGNIDVMDSFVDIGDKRMMFHTQPRGLTVHWLAGNVTVLGLFSIFSALITKNVCLVKASSRGYEPLIQLLDSLNQVKTEKISGNDITQAVAVVLIDRNDREHHQLLSSVADVRIAWGGQEAIQTIIDLKKSLYCEDLIFGPKYSYAAIDNESLKKNSTQLAQRLAVDVSVFDQYACSSPHTVFIEEKVAGESLQFAEALAKQLELVERTLLPKEPIDSGKAAEIISLRAEYEIMGNVFASKDTKWTVIHSDEPGLAKGCFSRVIFVKPISNLRELAALNNRQKQTLSSAFTKENKLTLLDEITFKGIDRVPDLSRATFFESPWDGLFVFDRLVRWISTYK